MSFYGFATERRRLLLPGADGYSEQLCGAVQYGIDHSRH